MLAFSVRGAVRGTFVTAFLEPVLQSDQPGPERVWLLSNESLPEASIGDSGLLARGARLPDRQDAGPYVIEVLVTRRPVSREQALQPRPDDLVARARFDTAVPP